MTLLILIYNVESKYVWVADDCKTNFMWDKILITSVMIQFTLEMEII